MVEMMASFTEIAAAIALIILFSAVMNHKNNDDDHTMRRVRVPVKDNRKNRR